MADNITLNAGVGGSTLATDDAGAGGHVQLVKLAIATDGSATPIPADAALGLQVDPVDRAARDLGKVDIASIDGPINGGTEATALRVTIANDSTGVVSVDDNGGALTVDGTVAITSADLGSVKTAVELIDNAVSGAGFNITQIGSAAAPIGAGLEATAVRVTLPTDGTGKVTAVSGTAANLKAEVTIAGAQTLATVTTVGTVSAVSAVTSTAATAKVDAALLGGAAVPIGPGVEATAIRVTLPTDGTGKVTAVSGTAANLKVEATIAAAQTLATVTTVGTVSAVSAITSAAANAKVDVGLLGGAAVPIGAGASATALRVEIAASSPDVTSLAIMDDWDSAGSDSCSVVGDVAHDTADAGEPVKIGAKAVASVLAQTLVAANDRSNLFCDLDGVLVVRANGALGDVLSERVSNTDGASTACTGAFAATASQRIYITDIIVHNAHATTNGYVDIRDGTAGAVLATIPLPATGGAVVSLKTPLRLTANTALAFDVSAAITTVYLSFSGFKSKA
jgi:hypothetical protein